MFEENQRQLAGWRLADGSSGGLQTEDLVAARVVRIKGGMVLVDRAGTGQLQSSIIHSQFNHVKSSAFP